MRPSVKRLAVQFACSVVRPLLGDPSLIDAVLGKKSVGVVAVGVGRPYQAEPAEFPFLRVPQSLLVGIIDRVRFPQAVGLSDGLHHLDGEGQKCLGIIDGGVIGDGRLSAEAVFNGRQYVRHDPAGERDLQLPDQIVHGEIDQGVAVIIAGLDLRVWTFNIKDKRQLSRGGERQSFGYAVDHLSR